MTVSWKHCLLEWPTPDRVTADPHNYITAQCSSSTANELCADFREKGLNETYFFGFLLHFFLDKLRTVRTGSAFTVAITECTKPPTLTPFNDVLRAQHVRVNKYRIPWAIVSTGLTYRRAVHHTARPSLSICKLLRTICFACLPRIQIQLQTHLTIWTKCEESDQWSPILTIISLTKGQKFCLCLPITL